LSEVLADMTTISVSGVCSLTRRITSKPDSAPRVRSTTATSKALRVSASAAAFTDVAHSTRYPRNVAATASIRPTVSSSSTTSSETGVIVMMCSGNPRRQHGAVPLRRKSRAHAAHGVRAQLTVVN
jgi:hypothetical protein